MMWLVALTLLLFEGLAVCTIGGMMASGYSAGLAITTAVMELTVGVIIVRIMYRDMKRVS